MPTRKFAVVGSGAVGCYYGGRLAHAGAEVHFLMRRDLPAVREHGLAIRSGQNSFHLDPVHAHATTGEIGPADIVLIALKTTSNTALETLIPPLLHENTILLTLQNGLGNEEFLAERFGGHRVLGGLCFVCLNRTAPGIIEHYGHGKLSIGEFNRPAAARTRELAAQFLHAGIEAAAVENLAAEHWRKLVWNIPFNGLAIASGGRNVAEILADPDLKTQTRALMREVIQAAEKLGYAMPPNFIEDQINRTIPMGPYKPSSLIDYLQGRELEVESIWGEPCRRAQAAGAHVPRLESLYRRLNILTSQNPNPHCSGGL